MRIPNVLVEVDRVCDYIPVVSMVSSTVDLFEKYVVCPFLSPEVAKNRYWEHIKHKEFNRSFTLIVFGFGPGNVYTMVCDYYKYNEQKSAAHLKTQEYIGNQQFRTNQLVAHAKAQTEKEVAPDQMMPAAEKDQQHLWYACTQNQPDKVLMILDKGTGPNFYNYGTTPLVTACQYAGITIVRALVERGAEVDTVDKLGNTPLCVACMKPGNLEMVQYLCEHTKNVNAPGPKGVTPLMIACANGDVEVVKFLLSKGAKSEQKAADGQDAVTHAIYPNDDVALLPLLFAPGEKIDDRIYQFTTQGIVESFTTQHLTPLLYAAMAGAKKSAEYLVAKSDVQRLDSIENNALFYALGHIKLLRALLNKCSAPLFVNQQNIYGSTVLHRALVFNELDAAYLLLEKGADPLREDKEGNTPLSIACEKRLEGVVNYIQQHYASKITSSMQEKIDTAFKDETSRQQVRGGLAPVITYMDEHLRALRSVAIEKAAYEKEVKALGPIPRTVMELLRGTLPQPL